MTSFDVLVVGGGATGLALTWDLAQRGLAAAVIEMGEFAGGTSGRYHGMLHSGARYAARDSETARECMTENAILRRIAPAAIEDTAGLFVLGDDDDPSYVVSWLDGCRSAGIPAREVPRAEVLEREPLLAPSMLRAFSVPDAVCNSHALCSLLQEAARGQGATLLPFHRLDGFLVESGRIVGAAVTDLRLHRSIEVRARLVVNAAGPWAGGIAGMAGIDLRMDLRRGAMAAWRGRLVHASIQRLRPPGDADVILPRGRVTIGGTTDVPTTDPGDRRIEERELATITAGLARFLPGLREPALVHAWSAVRPIFDPAGSGGHSTARGLSRGFSVIDHRDRDGVDGLVTVTGGKLATCRLMAEKAADLACRRLGVRTPCRTAETPL